VILVVLIAGAAFAFLVYEAGAAWSRSSTRTIEDEIRDLERIAHAGRRAARAVSGPCVACAGDELVAPPGDELVAPPGDELVAPPGDELVADSPNTRARGRRRVAVEAS